MDRRSEISRGLLILLLGLLFGLIAINDFLFSGGVLGLRHDWDIPAFSIAEYLPKALSSWEDINLGQPALYPSAYPLHLLFGLLGKLGLEGAALSKLLVIGAIGGALLTSFLLLRSLKLRFGPSLIASLFYISTPLLFDKIVAGQITYVVAYAILPLALLWFLRAQEEMEQWPGSLRFVRSSLIAGLFLGLVSIQLQFLVLLPAAFLLYSLTSSRRLIRSLAATFLTIGVALLVEAPWLLPLFTGGARTDLLTLAGSATVLRWLEQLSTPLIPTLALLSKANPYYASAALNSPLIPLGQLIVGLSLLGLIFRPRRRVLYFGLMFILGVLFAKGTYPPLPEVYPWLFAHLPGFSLFREVSHFLMLPAISVTVLLAVTFDALSDRIHLGRFPLYLLFLVVLGFYARPILSGNFLNQVQDFVPPRSYRELDSKLRAEPVDFRVMFLPTNQKSKFKDLTFAGTDPIISGSAKPAFSQEGNVVADQAPSVRFRNHLLNLLHFGRGPAAFRDGLSLASVGRVIFRGDFSNEFHRFTSLGQFPSHTRLWTNENIERVLNGMFEANEREQIGAITVYRHSPKSRIYATGQALLTADDLSILDEEAQSDLYLFASQNPTVDMSSRSLRIRRDEISSYVFSWLPKEYRLDPSRFALTHADAHDGFTRGVNLWWFDVALTETLEPFVVSFAEDRLTLPFTAPKTGTFQLMVKSLKWPEGGDFEISSPSTSHSTLRDEPSGSDSKSSGQAALTRRVRTKSEATAWDIDNLGQLALKQGERLQLTVKSDNARNAISTIGLVPEDEFGKLTSRASALIARENSSPGARPELSYERISPTRYIIKARATEPFWLVFTDSFSADWELRRERKEYHHAVGNFFSNAFYVDDPEANGGELSLELSFRRQPYYEAGLWTAGGTVALVGLFSLYYHLHQRAVRRRLEGGRRKGKRITARR